MAAAPSGARIMVEATIAPFMAISCTATGAPMRNAFFKISGRNACASPRRSRSCALRTQQHQAIARLTSAQASAVPIPAPSTPKCGISSALQTTSSPHITALSTLGVTMSPAHCKKPAVSELSCENGSISENVRKYALASAQISAPPPSQQGSFRQMPSPSSASSAASVRAAASPCRTTVRASVSSPAPMRCATCTEKPADTAVVTPPNSHVLEATRPMAAEASAPSAPTMAESIYCMAIVVICVRMAGRLSCQTSRSCGASVFQVCFGMTSSKKPPGRVRGGR